MLQRRPGTSNMLTQAKVKVRNALVAGEHDCRRGQERQRKGRHEDPEQDPLLAHLIPYPRLALVREKEMETISCDS